MARELLKVLKSPSRIDSSSKESERPERPQPTLVPELEQLPAESKWDVIRPKLPWIFVVVALLGIVCTLLVLRD